MARVKKIVPNLAQESTVRESANVGMGHRASGRRSHFVIKGCAKVSVSNILEGV